MILCGQYTPSSTLNKFLADFSKSRNGAVFGLVHLNAEFVEGVDKRFLLHCRLFSRLKMFQREVELVDYQQWKSSGSFW